MEADSSKTKFSKQMRQDLARLVIDGGQKCSDVAKQHSVPLSSLYAWVKSERLNALGSSESSLETTQSLREENVRLQRELKIARDHALFLRKAAAFFASEKK